MALSLCGVLGSNTGPIDCDVTRGNPANIMFGSSIFTPANQASNATLKAAFIDRMTRASGDSQKLFPLPVIQGTTDKGTAAKTGTYGYGLEAKLLRSRPGYEFRYWQVAPWKEISSYSTVRRSLYLFTIISVMFGVSLMRVAIS
jgi:hypothetical protein